MLGDTSALRLNARTKTNEKKPHTCGCAVSMESMEEPMRWKVNCRPLKDTGCRCSGKIVTNPNPDQPHSQSAAVRKNWWAKTASKGHIEKGRSCRKERAPQQARGLGTSSWDKGRCRRRRANWGGGHPMRGHCPTPCDACPAFTTI